jgi:hypothetical protein
VYAPPGGARLKSALLAEFGGARPVRFFLSDSDSILIAPVFGNPAGLRQAGLSEGPVRDQSCRPWLTGILWVAAKNPALGHTGKAAYTLIAGEYTKPASPSLPPADLPVIRVNEVIVAAPSEPVAARMIPPRDVPVQCQHTVTPVPGPPTRSPKWRPTQVRPADPVRAGDEAQAEYIIPQGSPLPPLWAETFRMRNYDIELDVQIGHGVQQPRLVLQRLVRAAYLKAHATLIGS